MVSSRGYGQFAFDRVAGLRNSSMAGPAYLDKHSQGRIDDLAHPSQQQCPG